MIGYYWVTGGGAGDCWWTALKDPRLRMLPGLVQDYGARIRVYTACHCPGVEDLFRHQPFVHEVITEPWHLPTPEAHHRFTHPIGPYVPLTDYYVKRHAGPIVRQEEFRFRYSPEEEAFAAELMARRPVIALQPYAGLSDRDGFDPERLDRLCERLVDLDKNCSVLVLGRNHDRGHKYAEERLNFSHPRVTNLIDRLGLRMSILLVSRADAFGGCHSNLIRAAWLWRRRTACVLPMPLMAEALHQLDPQYLFGFNNPECRVFDYRFTHGEPRQFETLDVEGIARHLLGR